MIRNFFLTLITLISVWSCTRNDGDIGPLFGAWKVEEVAADGVPVNLYGQDDGVIVYDWRFQSHLIQIQTVYEHYSYANVMGTWSLSDGILTLEFTGSDVDGEGFYTPPAPMHIGRGVTPLEILELKGSHLRLRYTAEDGITYTYRLKKAY